MSRKLSLSQAARMIGITRKQIQEKIQKNELRVMEGTVTLEDLKKAYPHAQYEDNTVLERMQVIMEKAVHKMAQSEREGAQIDALSKRAYFLNQELAKEKARAEFYAGLIHQLQQKFMQAASSNEDKQQLVAIQKWLHEQTGTLDQTVDTASKELMETQIQQFMQPHVRLLPSRHDFISDKSETLLESALRSGLALDYGCNNGQCGKCKVKLLNGKVEKVRHTDFILSEEEKQQNYILSCSHRAVTDVVLETREAINVDDIPLQHIVSRLKSIKTVNQVFRIATLRTPRSQRLRFLAGQDMRLKIVHKGQAYLYDTVISSCPCNDRNIQFHFMAKQIEEVPFLHILSEEKIKYINIEGPTGDFILDEDSPRSLIFIALEFGFAHLISLIEHALALDLEETIHLFWIVQQEEHLYLENQCRSWDDALDNFVFHPRVCHQSCEHELLQIHDGIINAIDQVGGINHHDYYIAGKALAVDNLVDSLQRQGAGMDQIHVKRLYTTNVTTCPISNK